MKVSYKAIYDLLVGVLSSKINSRYLNNIYNKWEKTLLKYMDIKYYKSHQTIEILDIESAIRLRKSIALGNIYIDFIKESETTINSDGKKTNNQWNDFILLNKLEPCENLLDLTNDLNKIFVAREPNLKKLLNGKIDIFEYITIMNKKLDIPDSESEIIYAQCAVLSILLNTQIHRSPIFHNFSNLFQEMLVEVHTNLYLDYTKMIDTYVPNSSVSEARKLLGLDNTRNLAQIVPKLQNDTSNIGSPIEEKAMYIVTKNMASAKIVLEKLTCQSINKEEINDMIREALYVMRDENCKGNIAVDFIRPYIVLNCIMLSLKKSFKRDIDLFFENTDNMIELKNKVKELDSNKKDKEISRLNKLLQEKDEYINKLEKQIKTSTVSLEREISDKNDIIQSLKRNLHDMLDVTIVEEDVIEEIPKTTSNIINIPISIVGGYPDLITRLKTNIPNLKWIDSINKINKTDVNLFFLTGLSTHGQKYRLDALNIKYIHINSKTPNTIFSEIYEKLK